LAELAATDRLQPSLLDRLTDDEPGNRLESRERRILSMRVFRQGVLRDLAWLLNTTCLAAVQNLTDYPLVARSVINFGLPDLTGRAASSMDLSAVERSIRQAIWDFEPRILRNSVQVRAVADLDAMGGHNSIVFELEGELWAQPLPERLFLRTELDLEMGSVKLIDLDPGR
jgi:type VI secretion system protein ImpF